MISQTLFVLSSLMRGVWRKAASCDVLKCSLSRISSFQRIAGELKAIIRIGTEAFLRPAFDSLFSAS